jgi:quercetin dioxygenase-like cupin family protein
VPAGREGLAATLRGLRATFPALALTVEDIRSDEGIAVARVTVRGATQGAFLGIPVGETTTVWGAVDLFRIANGAIAEHWGVPSNAAHFEPIVQGRMVTAGTLDHQVTLSRRTYAPGARHDEAAGPVAVAVVGERGALTVTAAGAGATPMRLFPAASEKDGSLGALLEPRTAATLGPNDLLVVPAETRLSTVNGGSEPAAVLVLALGAAIPVDGTQSPAPVATVPTGVATETLACCAVKPLPSEVIVRIGTTTLGPGAGIPPHIPKGPEVVVVESGTLELVAADAPAWVYHRPTRGVTTETLAVLATGDGATVPAGAPVGYRNPGTEPAAALVVAIEPGGRP